MIRINTEEIQRLADIVTRITSRCEDVLIRTKALRGEMETDPSFMASPKSISILEFLDSSVNNINQTFDLIQSLQRVLATAPETFQEEDQQLVNMILQITRRLDSLNAQFSVVMNSDSYYAVDRSGKFNSYDALATLVSGESRGLSIVNNADVVSVVRSQFPVKRVIEV